MSKNFDDLLAKLKVAKTKKLAVAVAQDEPVQKQLKLLKIEELLMQFSWGQRKNRSSCYKNRYGLSSFEIVHEADVKKQH